MNSQMSYAMAHARVADLTRDARGARHAEAMSGAEETGGTRAVPDGAFTRLRRWVGGTRPRQAVEGRGSAAA
jgi:hypothetical protein